MKRFKAKLVAVLAFGCIAAPGCKKAEQLDDQDATSDTGSEIKKASKKASKKAHRKGRNSSRVRAEDDPYEDAAFIIWAAPDAANAASVCGWADDNGIIRAVWHPDSSDTFPAATDRTFEVAHEADRYNEDLYCDWIPNPEFDPNFPPSEENPSFIPDDCDNPCNNDDYLDSGDYGVGLWWADGIPRPDPDVPALHWDDSGPYDVGLAACPVGYKENGGDWELTRNCKWGETEGSTPRCDYVYCVVSVDDPAD